MSLFLRRRGSGGHRTTGTPTSGGGAGGGATGIVLDASTPAIARQSAATGTTLTSASFIAPAGATMVVLANVGWGPAPTGTPTIGLSDTQGNTWVQQVTVLSAANYVQSAIFTSTARTATARTVTMTSSNTQSKALQLGARVYTGSSGIGATAVSNTSMTAGLTTTSAGSLVVVSADNGNNNALTLVTGTAADDAWTDTTSGDNLCIGHATALTTTPGAGTWGWTQDGISLAVELV